MGEVKLFSAVKLYRNVIVVMKLRFVRGRSQRAATFYFLEKILTVKFMLPLSSKTLNLIVGG